MFYRRNALPDLPELASLSGTELEDEKTRLETAKLRLEVQEEQSWRSKLIVTTLLSVLVPLGGVVVFLNTWFGARTGERKSAQDALYTEAAKDLSSVNASVRLNAVATLDSFLHPAKQTWFRREVNSLIGRGDENSGLSDEEDTATSETAGGTASKKTPEKAGKDAKVEGSASDVCDTTSREQADPAVLRECEILALLIGRLSDESDPAVLDAVSDVAIEHASAAVKPLLSLDRSAAIQFARAAGDFSATYILRVRRRTSMPEWDRDYKDATKGSIVVTEMVTLRTGSPFEAKNLMNERFASRDFFEETTCPFRSAFELEQKLSLSAGFSTPLLVKPPSVTALRQDLDRVVKTAAALEISSYVLGRLASDEKGLAALTKEDLYGVAVVVGELKDEPVGGLRSRGAYVWRFETDRNPGCKALPVP